MDKSRDEELVHQSLDDEDENAFEILYHRYEVPLLNFFYRRVRDWETAQDLPNTPNTPRLHTYVD